MFGKKPLACFRLNGSVEIEVLVAGFCLLNRLHAGEGDSTPFDRHQSNSTLILAKQPNRPFWLQVRKKAGEALLKFYLLLLVFFG